MHLLCTFAVLPTGRLTYASAVHIRCAASSAQNLQHVGGCAHSLRCQHTAPPVPWHTIPLVAAAVHILCAASKTCSPDIFSICSRSAVHILCAASTHHGRIRSMLLSLYVECIRCAHPLCCQQAASRMPPREQHQKYKLSLPKNVALILHKQLFERIWLQMLSQSQDHHTTVTL